VRWVNHKCKVNSDEFDRVFWRSDEGFHLISVQLGSAWLQPMRACGVVSLASATTSTRAEPRPQAKEYTLGLQPLTDATNPIQDLTPECKPLLDKFFDWLVQSLPTIARAEFAAIHDRLQVGTWISSSTLS
jgi:hypothetical protein